MSFDQRASDFDEKTPWASREAFISECIKDLALQRPAGHVLDLGGGTAILSSRFSEIPGCSSVTVVDASAAMLALAPANVQTLHCQIEDFTPSRPYDTILFRQVLHYLESPREALNSARSWLSPQGRIYIGQLVSPTQDISDLLLKLGRSISEGRYRSYTEETLLSQVAEMKLSVQVVRRFSYAEAVEHWVNRIHSTTSNMKTVKQELQSSEIYQNSISDMSEIGLTWLHIVLAST